MENIFNTSPTTNTTDTRLGTDELIERIHKLEQRVDSLEQRLAEERRLHEEQCRSGERQEPQPKKIKFKKIRKFFNAVMKPVLTFIPNFLNALANYKKTAAAS